MNRSNTVARHVLFSQNSNDVTSFATDKRSLHVRSVL
jgi:hypothetical protein